MPETLSSESNEHNERTVVPLSVTRGAWSRASKGDDEDESKTPLFTNLNKGLAMEWPQPPSKEAFHGLAGDYVRRIEPHTESDLAAILLQILVAVGNVVGRTGHFLVEADKHYLNLFAVLAGETSRSRKGTSWGHARSAIERVDPTWRERFGSGLSSGEGLIHAVRDPQFDDDGGLIDAGVDDKRLMVVESEFVSPLRVITRDGNILSPIVRAAWDESRLQVLAKNTGEVATNAHISIIGHITIIELRGVLREREMANGFANRHLWAAVRRSNSLPDGGKLKPDDIRDLDVRLKAALLLARVRGEMIRTPEAAELWREMYDDLTSERDDLVGAITARAEAQVMRLACIYACLDKSSVVQPDHLLAAKALWDFCRRSVEFIFGEALGHTVADRILAELRSHSRGMTRTDIRDLFSRNRRAGEIEAALNLLQERGLVRVTTETTGGRPATIWFAVRGTTTTKR